MCKFNPKNDGRFLDPCIREEIKVLNKRGIVTLACCCGHGIYPKTIVVRYSLNDMPYEMHIKEYLPRKKKFYKKDKQGVYYIPEVKNVI